MASAPSVEQEDYRTPKPLVFSIKNGKSFDFGGGNECASLASNSNGLIKVGLIFAFFQKTIFAKKNIC